MTLNPISSYYFWQEVPLHCSMSCGMRVGGVCMYSFPLGPADNTPAKVGTYSHGPTSDRWGISSALFWVLLKSFPK